MVNVDLTEFTDMMSAGRMADPPDSPTDPPASPTIGERSKMDFFSAEPVEPSAMPNLQVIRLTDDFGMSVSYNMAGQWNEFTLLMSLEAERNSGDPQNFRRLLSAALQKFGDQIYNAYAAHYKEKEMP